MLFIVCPLKHTGSSVTSLLKTSGVSRVRYKDGVKIVVKGGGDRCSASDTPMTHPLNKVAGRGRAGSIACET